jgi:CRISPR-associated protein (TIGR03986 family)
MKTAKLVKHGKGWRLEGEKTMPVPGDFGLTDDMEGQKVEFDNTGGPVKLIRYQGKDYTKIQHQDMGSTRDHRRQGHYGNPRHGQRYNPRGSHPQRRGQQDNDPARAPYNFVPLNEDVVPAHESVSFDGFAAGRLSGYIDIKISALSDIFVRGQLEKFFSVNGNFAIPGSSLRGLARMLVEIASYSRMEMVERNRKFFFRNIGDPFYKDVFLDIDNRSGDVRQKSKPGWLSKSGNQYFLQEAPTFYKVSRRKLEDVGLDIENVYTTKDIWFNPDTVDQVHTKKIRTKRGEKELQLYYNKVRSISIIEKPGLEKATLLITGLFGRNKHFQWIIPDPDVKALKKNVTSILQEYEIDESRDEGANLIKALRSSGRERIPCFFISDEVGNPLAIGHTGLFRYPYKYQIGHAIKQKDQPNLDMAKSIFGYADTESKTEKILSGKVWFEDAYAIEVTGTEFGALRILSSPKPTSFQLYLEQPKGQEHHWGTAEHNIRGNKLYWHSNSNWRNPEIIATDQNKNELIIKALKLKNEQFTVGEVLKSGSTFKGRIRFENLTEEELGALLFVLDLPKDCAHKLGMGKPIGLGSVRISPTLTIFHRKERYQEIFDAEGNWIVGKEKNADSNTYKNAFAKYIGEKTSQGDINSTSAYWEKDQRMQELKCMLTYQHSPNGVSWENRTRYMLIEHPTYEPKNEYRDKYTRHVLPNPSEVVNPDTYKKS